METTATTYVASAIQDGNVSLDGVLKEVIALLPVCIPVMITFAAIRKGIGFLSGILHSA